MEKKLCIELLKLGFSIGFVAGNFLAWYEMIQYATSSFWIGLNSPYYLFFLLFSSPLVAWFFVRKSSYSFFQNFVILFSAHCCFYLILGLCLSIIHLDSDYKEAIANNRVESIKEKNKKLEQRIGADIASSVNYSEIKTKTLNLYAIQRLLLFPIYALPFSIVGSLLFAWLFSILQKYQT